MLFAVLFGAALVLIRIALPEGAEPGSQWLIAGSDNIRIAAAIMPFAGIAFLWFMGVVRDGLGSYEDKFFSTVFIGSGLLFLAMVFVTSAVGAALTHSTGEVVPCSTENVANGLLDPTPNLPCPVIHVKSPSPIIKPLVVAAPVVVEPRNNTLFVAIC